MNVVPKTRIQKNALSKDDAGELSLEKLNELRLYGFFSFTIWPIIVVLGLFIIIINVIKGIITRSGQPILKTLKIYLSFLILPLHLIKWGFGENFKIVAGIVLLFPFLLVTFLSIFTIAFPATATTEILKAPSLYYPFGTNGEGFGIGKLIIAGAQHIYFTSLMAALLSLTLGVWFGKMTFQEKAKSIIMSLVQFIEAIPILFLLLIVLAVFSWWEDIWKAHGFSSTFLTTFRILVIGLVIGFGFLPRIIRVLEERIKTFVSENFVDATKAHGIEQNRILWFHIIKKNCMGDIIIAITQIWAATILIEISLDYLISISPLLGAKIYQSWAGMLLTFEVRNAIVNFLPELNFDHWWLYVFPGFFIISTVIGFYQFGDGLRAFYYQKSTWKKRHTTNFDYDLNTLMLKLGIIE